jgi:hypothetical protein
MKTRLAFHVILLVILSTLYFLNSNRKKMTEILNIRPHSRTHKKAFIGVLTTIERFNRRALIRSTYALLKPDDLDLFFVSCKTPLMNEKGWRTLVQLEKKQFKDILLLDCKENMNSGKTFNYIQTLSKTFTEKDYEFYVKTDDDTFLNLPKLEEKLNEFPSYGGPTQLSCSNHNANTKSPRVILWERTR